MHVCAHADVHAMCVHVEVRGWYQVSSSSICHYTFKKILNSYYFYFTCVQVLYVCTLGREENIAASGTVTDT